jgi:hypothetical protein
VQSVSERQCLVQVALLSFLVNVSGAELLIVLVAAEGLAGGVSRAGL